MAVRALVRELMAARSLVTLYAADDPDHFIVTRLLALEADSLEFDFSGDAASQQALMQAPYLTVVGVPGPVTIQFRITDVEVVQSAGAANEGPGASLTAPVPSHGWRVQRRNAFRVKPPSGDQATVAVRLPGNAEFHGQLTDLSVGGLSVLWQTASVEPELGATLRHCRIDADDIAPIPCDLRVVRVDRPAGSECAQVSCEFEAMPQSVSRFVQLYVMDIEKRARLALRKG